jgi:hypothetical protein
MSAVIYPFPTRPLLDRTKAHEAEASAKTAKDAQDQRIRRLLKNISANLDIIDGYCPPPRRW